MQKLENVVIMSLEEYKDLVGDNQPKGFEVYKFAALKEAHKKGAVIQFELAAGNWFDIEGLPVWYENINYRIKPTPKAIGVRTDCLIMGEVTEQTETTISINNLRFLKDQVTFLSEEEYHEIRKVYD